MINREYYSLMTNYGTNLINSLVLPGTTSFIANGWYIELGDGIQDITPETTSLANTIYGKDSDNYVGITFGNDSIYGRYAKLEIPSTVQGVIREAGLFDGDDNLICVAKCLIDLSSTEQIGMLYDASIQLYVKAIPSDVEIVYVNPSNVPTKDYVDAAIAAAVANLDQFEEKSKKGVANGYAPLDETSKVPLANLPELPNKTNIIYKKGMANPDYDPSDAHSEPYLDKSVELKDIILMKQSEFDQVDFTDEDADRNIYGVNTVIFPLDYTAYQTVTANTTCTFSKSGRFVCDTTALAELTLQIANNVSRKVPASWLDIPKGMSFTSNLAGKFYYFEGQD